MIIGFELSTGTLLPRQARDSQGKATPLAVLTPVSRSFGGVRLGMTPDMVLANKGEPILKDDKEWVYNTVDARHDGVLSVTFSPVGGHGPRRVISLEFDGQDPGSAPPEIPYLESLTAAEAIDRYGEPILRRSVADGIEFLWFQNGAVVRIHRGKINGYGIYDLALLGG
jgi:hypothetical protein